MFSVRGAFPNNQVAELGGELVDSGHTSIRTMCQTLGIPINDLRAGETFVDERFFINGRYVSEGEILEAFRPLAAEMRRAVRRSERSSSAFAALDAMSVAEWIDSTGVATKDLKDLLHVAYTEEFGLEADEQTVFNLLYMIDYERLSRFRVFGESDERFHIRGGNDRVTTALANRLEGQIETSSLFTSLRETSGGSFRVGVSRDSGFREYRFDIVVLALPFTLLREANLDVDLPNWKRQIIRELGYGTNAKLMSGYTTRHWRSLNATGSVIGNNGIQTCWDTSRKQPGESGILTIFQGGTAGVNLGTGTAETQMQQYLRYADELFPGIANTYVPGSAVRMWWPGHQFTKGSYSCYRPGQAAFSGLEGKRIGNLFFCGEHCSINFQGYMEGGCESGLKTAIRVLKRLSVRRESRDTATT
jgi:monoamine oxidase